MPDLTARALHARRLCGDRAVLDWLEVARSATHSPLRDRITTAELRQLWDCTQPTVSRRLAAINGAPPSAGLGRVERLKGAHGWWRVTLPATTTTTRTGDHP